MSLKDTPLGKPEEFNVVIEIPKGSEKKFEYDEATDQIVVDFIFTDGFKYFFNYGFIPQTKAQDGDTLDVIVLGPTLESGAVVLCRPIGIIKQLDRGQEDHKVVAVPVDCSETEKLQNIQDLKDAEWQRFKDFYTEIGRQKQKKIEIIGFEDKDQAVAEIKKSML